MGGTRPIWNRVAKDYDRFVTHPKKNPLLTQYLESEQDYLEKIIRKAHFLTQKKVTVFEVGSGTGRIAFDLMDNEKVADIVKYYVGIDNAEVMANEANRLCIRGMATKSNYNEIFFELMDALDLKESSLEMEKL